MVPEALDAELKGSTEVSSPATSTTTAPSSTPDRHGWSRLGDSLDQLRPRNLTAESIITQIIDITEQMQAHQAAENARHSGPAPTFRGTGG